MRILMLFTLSCLMVGTAQAELYRWVDGSGNVHYSDRPLPGTAEVETLKVAPPPSPDDSLPYETRRAMQAFPVTLYVSPNCGTPCSEAQALLKQRGIPYSEQNLDTAEKIEAYRSETGGLEVPVVRIGKTRLKGFLAAQWHKELDFAGYPKAAPFRPRTAP